MRKLQMANINGKGYELGIKFSKLFDNIDDDFSYFKGLLKDNSIKKKLDIVKAKLKDKYPEYLEETYGRADGLNINRDEYLLNICFEIYDSREACTDIIIKTNNNILFGHNEDLPENLNEMALVKYECDDVIFCELSTYNCPQGTTFGWNNYGIVYSVNSIDLYKNNEIGIPIYFILRDIVKCKNIDEIIKKIDIKDCASAFSLNIVDCNTNKAYSIEKVLDKLDVIEITDKYAHTNHLIHNNSDKCICEIYDSTIIRLNTANELLGKLDIANASLNDIKYILQFDKSENEYVHRKIGIADSSTVATFLFNGYTKEIQICSYYDNNIINSNMNNL